jgi:hypothetical protein
MYQTNQRTPVELERLPAGFLQALPSRVHPAFLSAIARDWRVFPFVFGAEHIFEQEALC